MTHDRTYSLAFLTISDCDPIEAISVAAEAGYDMVGLRLLPATLDEKEYPLLHDNKKLREVKLALLDTGIRVGDIELIRLNSNFLINSFLPFLSRASELGAQNITVVGDDYERERLINSFGELCSLAVDFGLAVNLEPIPWTSIPTVMDAKSIIDAVNKNNAALLLDALHVSRSDNSLEIIGRIPQKLIQVFQICDAPIPLGQDIDEFRNFARTARLPPGEGELNLRGLINFIPKSAIVSIEVPNRELIKNMTPVRRASMMLKSTKQLYSQLYISGAENG